MRRPNLTAVHRPATRRRRFAHDELVAVDLFSGFGGLTQGIEAAGFTALLCANHNAFKVEVHEANHPHAEHWIADLVDPEASDYHSARDLPAADLLAAGVSCDLDDPEFEARVTRSERDRATAFCVLQYAAAHHPRLILVECTTELASWGPAIPGKAKVGDGSTYRWWLKQLENLGYKYRVLYLNSMFFGVPQSRDRLYLCAWDKRLPTPDLDHRPPSWCSFCEKDVEAVWTWRTGVPASGRVRYGEQYEYRCPSCRGVVIPPITPSLAALDFTNLGTRIGDRDKPLAPASMARAERCRQKFAEFPAIVMPAESLSGSMGHPWQPVATQGAEHDTAIVSTGGIVAAAGNTYEHPGSSCRSRDLGQPLWAQTATNGTGILTAPTAIAVDNYQGSPRGVDEALPTQAGSETLGLLSARVLPNRTNGTSRSLGEPMETLVGNAGSGGLGVLSSGVLPYRRNTVPTTHAEAMPTVTADQIPGLLTAAGRIQHNGSIEEAKYRAYPLDQPLGTVVGSANTQGVLFSGWYKQNGSRGDETAPHPVIDPFGTLTSRDTTALLSAQWHDMLADLRLEDCYYRMLATHEVGRGCGFDVDFAGYKGTFVVWGSASSQVNGFGNAVSPPVGEFLGGRLRAVLHNEEAAA